MTNAARTLLEQFNALPEEDQRWFLDALVSRAPEVGVREAWTAVALERLERAERGEDELISYDTVRAHVLETLRDG